MADKTSQDKDGIPLGSVSWRVAVPMLGISLPVIWAMQNGYVSKPVASMIIVGSLVPAGILVWVLYKKLVDQGK